MDNQRVTLPYLDFTDAQFKESMKSKPLKFGFNTSIFSCIRFLFKS